MANVFFPNYPIPSSTNVMAVVWKLTRAMKKAGWNVVAHSDGVTKIAAGTNANDSWGTNIDPSLDVYPSAFDTAQIPWIVLSGPKTLKIPLSGAPTGTLLRGEKITQAVSAAEGELVGYVWSIADSSGWAVVLPRTGTFNNSNIITGATSAATFTPTGTIVSYAREVMFGKTVANNTLNGQIFYTCADPVTESTAFFSYLATQTGCTATIPPGCGGTNNGFPTFGNAASPTGGAIAVRGTGGSTTSAEWFGTTGGYVGNAQVVCVNATPAAGISADGSFYIAAASNTTTGALAGFAYQRVDDGEPGDVDPYVWIHVTNSQQGANWLRTANVSYGANSACYSGASIFQGSTYPAGCGYVARGVTVSTNTRDIATCYMAALNKGTVNNFALIDSNATVRTLNHPSATSPPIVREHILIFATGTLTNTFHQFKGRLRWMFCNSVGSALGTSDSNTFVCVNSAGTYPAIYIGPYDGSTTPA